MAGTKPPFSFGTDVWPGLIKVQEETSELGVELAKLTMVGGNEDMYWGQRPLRENILDEVADVLASTTYFMLKNFDDEEIGRIRQRVARKLNQYAAWETEDE